VICYLKLKHQSGNGKENKEGQGKVIARARFQMLGTRGSERQQISRSVRPVNIEQTENMNAIKQSYIIKAPIKTVWEALTDPKVIDAWGAGPSTMSEEEGFQFSLWGGQIHGKNTEVIKEKKLVQEWLAWKAAFGISTLTIDLEDNNRTTTVNLLHINVPTKNTPALSVDGKSILWSH
jgi:uncharacterized protein YndB with AHSA1/START domain